MPDPEKAHRSDSTGTRAVRHRFDAFPVLSNDRLLLRRVVASDAAVVREISFYDVVPATSDREATAMLERIDRDYRRGESVHWGICMRGSAEVVGVCGFYRGYPDDVGEVGYALRKAYRGRGIMTSALRLVVAFGLEDMKLAGIVAYAEPANVASAGVLERSGFERATSEPNKWSLSVRSAATTPRGRALGPR